MSRARQSVPSTHAKRIEILFQPDAVDGIVAMCIEMSGSPKFEYHPSGSVVRFTPAEFRLYMENLRAAMRDRDLDQQDKIEAREAYSSAMEQYYRQEQAGGISIGAPNPLSDLSTAQTVGIVAAGAAALGIVGFFIWKSQQPALWDAFNSPGTVPPGVLTPPGGSPYSTPPASVPPPGATIPRVTPQGTLMWTGDLPTGYAWKNQGTAALPGIGTTIQALVVAPDGSVTPLYGTVDFASFGGSPPCPPGAMCSDIAMPGGLQFTTTSSIPGIIAQGKKIYLASPSYVSPAPLAVWPQGGLGA